VTRGADTGCVVGSLDARDHVWLRLKKHLSDQIMTDIGFVCTHKSPVHDNLKHGLSHASAGREEAAPALSARALMYDKIEG
jgi:hypothetical protein